MNTMIQNEIQQISPAARQAALQAELEATQAAFHRCLESVTTSRWPQKSPSSAWTMGEVLVHLTWALEYLPEEVERARHGKGMFNMPKRLSDTMSYWYIRWLAIQTAPETLARRYDQAMNAAIRKLAEISEDEWKLGANFYGEGFHSVEDLFHVPARHLEEHTGNWH